MTKDELKIKLSDLHTQYMKEQKAIMIEYANSHSTVKVDDIIADHIGSIKVEKIDYYKPLGENLYECIYTGIELKKDLTPTKKGERRTVYQSNLGKK